MRILIYGLNYTPEPTGIGKYTGEMGAWLVERGHEVDAIVAPPYYPWWEVRTKYRNTGFLSENIDGVGVFRVPLFVPAAERVSTRNRFLHETSFNVAASRYWLPILLRRRRYDAVIAVCQPVQIGVYPWLYKRFRGVPFVLHVQDLQVDVAVRLGMIKNDEVARALQGVENAMLRSATCVSTITQTMRRRVMEKGVPEKRTWLFPNWAETHLVRPMQRDNPVRRKLGVKPHDVMVLYAGSMGEKQGLESILSMAERLREQARIKFVMVGSGAAKKQLERTAASKRLNNVSFLPIQPMELLPSMLAAGDIHLVVQRREAADLVMPSKLTNILAAGRPSVATADPGTALYEVLNAHECGVTTTPGDVEELAETVVRLADDTRRRERLGCNARKYAEFHLDKETILRGFEEKLQAVAWERS